MIRWSMRLRSIDEWHGEDDLKHYAFHDSEVTELKGLLMDAVKMKQFQDERPFGCFYDGVIEKYWSEDD